MKLLADPLVDDVYSTVSACPYLLPAPTHTLLSVQCHTACHTALLYMMTQFPTSWQLCRL
jgi:hypothetical protein